eukprot:CAMPEP_0185723270 /NCGR_PEP_ID=MMETSP1171-20130828/164_1 /TAXON_ID=374046 /ORGANISM="Helicotheca tamensis, Strain CCMP826" /LENGTH=282 /DNA_ID=CAMNT_0028390943 /DNA_START=435 /DNA_END=1280 /DNA_ORIENTATION=+
MSSLGTRGVGGGETATAEFDALRREATKLERHLEDRVARYQELAQRLATGDDGADSFNRHGGGGSNYHHGGGSHGRSSLLESAEAGTLSNNYNNSNADSSSPNIDEEEQALSADISRTISAMTDLINTRMSPAAERTGKSQHSLLVKRYREILFDCSADFKKTSASVARRRDAMELFRGANTSGAGNGSGDRDPAMEQLLRERSAIGNATKSATSVLGQAEEIHADLRSQGDALRGVSGLVVGIANQVPGLNNLMDRIKRKKNKDDMIVSGVIATCILFTLW